MIINTTHVLLITIALGIAWFLLAWHYRDKVLDRQMSLCVSEDEILSYFNSALSAFAVIPPALVTIGACLVLTYLTMYG